MVRISSSVLVVYCIALKTVVQCPRGSISTSYRTVGVTYLELSYYCIDNQLVVLKDFPFLLDRKPLSGSGAGWRRRRRRRRRRKRRRRKRRRKHKRSGGE
jgi:hypothetical protein